MRGCHEEGNGKRLKHMTTSSRLAQIPSHILFLVNEKLGMDVPGNTYGLYTYISLFSFPRYLDLLSLLPAEVKDHCYCQQLLATLQDLSQYMCQVGPQRMSKKRLMQVGEGGQ